MGDSFFPRRASKSVDATGRRGRFARQDLPLPLLLLFAAGSSVLTIGGCSGDSGGPQVCGPGLARECLGPGMCMGSQICASDGRSWGVCDCGHGGGSGGATSTGGVGGSAGAGGLGGSAGGAGGSGGGFSIDAADSGVDGDSGMAGMFGGGSGGMPGGAVGG